MNKPKAQAGDIGSSSTRLWIVLSIGIDVLSMAAWITWLFWPTWEDKHKDEVRALITQAGEAMGRKDLRVAYDRYDRAVAMTEGHIDVATSVLASDIVGARQNRNKLQPLVSAQLDQERRAKQAAERAAISEQQRAEAAKRLAAQHAESERRQSEQRAAAEEAERERAAKRAAAAEAIKQAEARRVERVRASDTFAATIRESEAVYQQTLTILIAEDSAYRVISRWADANTKLLEILARQQALIRGKTNASRLDLIERRHATAIAGEDSAIRAAYIHDRTALEYVGAIARVWTDDPAKNSKLASEQTRLTGDIERKLITDDSAPRAISAYNDGLLQMWAILANAREQDVSAIVTDATVNNATDDSAWRVADRLAAAQAKVVLALLRQDWPERANDIERAMLLADITETSALRSLGNKKRVMAETLVALISNHSK